MNKNNKLSQSVLGVVLAGGLSKRMGQNKAALIHPRQQRTMLSVQQALLNDAGIKHTVISGEHNHGLKDLHTQAGPLAGIYSVIKAYRPSAILAVAVDMPMLQVDDISQLIRFGHAKQQAVCFSKHPLPLYLPITRDVNHFFTECFGSELMTLTKGPSFKQLFQQCEVTQLIPNDEMHLFNANTPSDWLQVRAHFENNEVIKNM